MIYYVLFVMGGGAVLLWVICHVVRELGRMEKENEIAKEREKQHYESKDHDNLSDADLLDWLHDQDK